MVTLWASSVYVVLRHVLESLLCLKCNLPRILVVYPPLMPVSQVTLISPTGSLFGERGWLDHPSCDAKVQRSCWLWAHDEGFVHLLFWSSGFCGNRGVRQEALGMTGKTSKQKHFRRRRSDDCDDLTRLSSDSRRQGECDHQAAPGHYYFPLTSLCRKLNLNKHCWKERNEGSLENKSHCIL